MNSDSSARTGHDSPNGPANDPAPKLRGSSIRQRVLGQRILGQRRLGATLWVVALVLVALLIGVGVGIDWWTCLPSDARAQYVGRERCIACHSQESELFIGSHHDLAMDLATPDTVLADFNDATLEHYGITSRMHREGDEFFVTSEGPDGQMRDYQVKYVLGVEPLQQYMVELERGSDLAAHEVGRVQVLRETWDTLEKRWYYLMPPDVDEKMAPDDPLHWTRVGQNWNHMCADCHSTNYRKGYDLATHQFHSTFSEIDVSCEACHGPASLHVQLAEAKSLFWDRRLGYGLAKLKTDNSDDQMDVCAQCHSRRDEMLADYEPGDDYHDFFRLTTIDDPLYYPDGQIRDEVYVYGSFKQSKMYHNDVRCTDCHDPHSARLIHEGNQVCVSCHQHTPAKYDTPAHHRHETDSTGALCADCHMPQTPYMGNDLRRDHRFTIPKPEESLEFGTPNACTGCHLDKERVPEEIRDQLVYFSNWLELARAGNEDVQAELDRVNQWSLEWCEKWYPEASKPRVIDKRPDWTKVLAGAWQVEGGGESVHQELVELADNGHAPAIIRASALGRLRYIGPEAARDAAIGQLRDRDPIVRMAALQNLSSISRREMAAMTPAERRKYLETVGPSLFDEHQTLRVQAALALATVPDEVLNSDQREARKAALDIYRRGQEYHGDQPGAHMALALLAEQQEDWAGAQEAYLTAIRVAPQGVGPRSNLAALLERLGNMEQAEVQRLARMGHRSEAEAAFNKISRLLERARELRGEEAKLMARDARLLGDNPQLFYQHGLSLYLAGQVEEAEAPLLRATELAPRDVQYRLVLTLLYEKLQRWPEALKGARQVVTMEPDNESYQNLLIKIEAEAKRAAPGSAGDLQVE